MVNSIYSDGRYLERNPTWHAEDSDWKADAIERILQRNGVQPRTIAEVGCGAGGILKALSAKIPGEYSGFDISDQAIAIARQHQGIRFLQEDLLASAEHFDLLLAIDVFEHVPDYMGFIEKCRARAAHVVYHIPLDMHVSGLLRDAQLTARQVVGHLHYFSEATALATLRDTGHEVVDYFHTCGTILSPAPKTTRRVVANVPRRMMAAVSPRWAAKLLGGFSLMVLCRGH